MIGMNRQGWRRRGEEGGSERGREAVSLLTVPSLQAVPMASPVGTNLTALTSHS